MKKENKKVEEKEIMEKGFYCKNEIAPCWAMKEFYKKYICKGK